jgi:hypothetical protein
MDRWADGRSISNLSILNITYSWTFGKLFQLSWEASQAYEVRLEQAQGLKIKKLGKSGGPDMIRITLEIKENAPVQNAEWVFSSGKNTFTQEYPIRIKGTKH